MKVIANMYTGAEAKFFINGVMGKTFPITRGVAQGCALSPLFFTIYIDDLLQRFRESQLGIPTGRFLHNAFSFADDLLLGSPDEETLKKYITILTTWCKENKMTINVVEPQQRRT